MEFVLSDLGGWGMGDITMVSRGYLPLSVSSFARVIVSFQRQERTTENLREIVRYQELLSLEIVSVTQSFVVPHGESDTIGLETVQMHELRHRGSSNC